MKMAYSSTKVLLSVLMHYLTQPTMPGLDQDGWARLLAIVRKLAELVQLVVAEVEKIFNDPKLTDEGKQDKLLAVGPRIVGNFKNLGVVRDEADKAQARLEQLIFSPLTTKPAGDAVVTFLREDAIRRSLDKGQAGLAFLEAINRGDMETARATLDWPGSPMISEEFVRRGREAFALRTNRDAWEKLQFIEVLREHLSGLAQQVASWLLLLGASPADVQQATGVEVPSSAKVLQLNEYLAQTVTGKK